MGDNTDGLPAATPSLTNQELIAELLRERKRDRKASILKTLIFALIGVAYFAAMGGFFFLSSKPSAPPSNPFAAVVPISGVIGEGKSASFDKLAPQLRRAFNAENSVGVILDINSPGGTPVQSALIHDLIIELKESTGKPVIAVGSDVMASGAYMIAVSADRIVANRSSVVGSIGVISAGFGFTDLIEKAGIERRVATAGGSKNLTDPFSPVTEKGEAIRQTLLDSIHVHFKDVVVAGRGNRLDPSKTTDLFEGAVWTGKQGVEIGLLDGLGRVDTEAKETLGTSEIYRFESSSGLFTGLMKGIGAEVAQAMQVKAPLLLQME